MASPPRRLAGRFAAGFRRARAAAPVVIRQAAPVVVRATRRTARAGAASLGQTVGPLAAGGAASLLYRVTGKVASDPLARAGILAGAALVLPAVPFARRILIDVRGFAGAAGFALGQAVQAKWFP